VLRVVVAPVARLTLRTTYVFENPHEVPNIVAYRYVPSVARSTIPLKRTDEAVELLVHPVVEVLPASVVTTADERSTFWIAVVVPRYASPPTTTTPPIAENSAEVPVPFNVAFVPFPANVETEPIPNDGPDPFPSEAEAGLDPVNPTPAETVPSTPSAPSARVSTDPTRRLAARPPATAACLAAPNATDPARMTV
jgi:hypothetical protein